MKILKKGLCGGGMKDKIISFLLISIIIAIVGIIVYIGYMVYTDISKDGRIEINFESETGFPTIEYIPSTRETIDVILNEEMFEGVESSNMTSKKEPQGESKQIQSRYLYQQLDDIAKAIYVKLYNNKENLKTGTYTVEFDDAFQSLLLEEGGDDKLKTQYQSAIEALVYENPDIFYLDVTKMYINIEKITKITGTKYNVYINNGNDITYLSEGFYCKEDVELYENEIKQIKNRIVANLQGKTDYEKIKIVHDYLIDTIEYDEGVSGRNTYDVYGALVNKRCVCEGYAKAFQYLMNELGIENTIVIGTGTNSKNQTENHAWNYVKIDNKWYAIDVTWDDPILLDGATLTNKSRYEYFLKGSNTMNENHFPSGKFTQKGQIFKYPVLSVEDYK